MPRENVELVRTAFAAMSRGDIDGALALAADDLVFDWSNSIGPEKGVYRGKDQIREFWTTLYDAFEEVSWNAEEIIEVDDTRLIAVNHIRMRGRGSGVAVDAVGAQLWTIVDGEGRSIKLYQSKDDALEAVGQQP
jgi:ketosteroid isomerase-like protein